VKQKIAGPSTFLVEHGGLETSKRGLCGGRRSSLIKAGTFHLSYFGIMFETIEGVLEKHECYQVGSGNIFSLRSELG